MNESQITSLAPATNTVADFEGTEALPVLAWALREDGSVTGLVAHGKRIVPAESLARFIRYVARKGV